MKMNFNFAAPPHKLCVRCSNLCVVFVLNLVLSTITHAGNFTGLFLPPDTIFIDIACIGDRELYNRFGGTADPQAETKALNYMDTIINRVANRYAPILNTYNPSNYVYQFRIVTKDVLKSELSLYGGPGKDIVVWKNHTDFWKNAYPCADDLPDIIHVFSGHSVGYLTSPGGKSFYGWGAGSIWYNNSCLLGNSITLHGEVGYYNIIQDSLYNLALVAHEMGHNFGLIHLEDTGICNGLCASQSYMMCASNNNSTQLSSCDYTRLQNTLTNSTLINCLKPAIRATVDTNCTHCQITFMPMASPEVVAKGCVAYEEFDYEVEVWNNCDSANRVIRIEFGKNFIEVVDPGIFTAVEEQSLTQLRILDSAGQEKPVLFDSEEKKIFSIRLKVKDQVTISVIPVRTHALLTNGTLLGSYEHKLPNAVNVSTSPGNPVYSLPTSNHPAILLNTNLILTQSLFNSGDLRYIFCTSGVDVLIQSNLATFRNVEILGCTEMWKGITVAPQANLNVESSYIMDAQYALNAQLGARMTVTNTRFENNNIGIRHRDISAAGNPDSSSIIIAGNSFLSSSGKMKPPYSGQSPQPMSRGYAGIYLVNSPGVAIQKSATGSLNTFDGLLYGIVGINSAFTVRNSVFRNMIALDQPISGYPTVWTGVGVFSSNSFVSIEGMGAGSKAMLSFENCPVGIETFHSSLNVNNCRMEGMGEGIRFLLGTTNRLDIKNNRINASLRGISTFQPGVFSKSTSITNNFITMSGENTGIGIQLGIADGPKLPPQKALVQDNTITLQEGHAGIRVSTARGVDLFRNKVLVENENTPNGIHTLGSHNLLVHCNYISGDDASVNLRADGSWLSTWACNRSDGGGVGLNFSGECSGSDVRGNKIIDLDEGMYYGMPGTGIGTVLVGTQEHRGNVFDNSGAVYAGDNIDVVQNRHIVDPNQNAQFYPVNISGPLDWFISQGTGTTTFACTFVDCPPQSLPVSREDDDNRIAADSIFAEHFQEALLGQAKKHLYSRLSEDGLPGGSTQVLQDFMSPTSATAYQQFGDVDLVFRNAFAVSGATDTLLYIYEQALASGLTTLKGLDSLLLSKGLSSQDSTTITGQRDTLLTGIADTFGLWMSVRTSLANDRRVLLDSVAVQNSSLSPSFLWESTEKAVRGIYLATVGTDTVLTFTETQSTQLHDIAEQCPLEGGIAVYWARAMLEMLTKEYDTYDDEDLCTTAADRHPETGLVLSATAVRIFPNPTKGIVRVEYNLGAKIDGVFTVYNLLGQQVLQRNLPDGQGSISIDMSGLPTGTYFYFVPRAGQKPVSGKIVCSKN